MIVKKIEMNDDKSPFDKVPHQILVLKLKAHGKYNEFLVKQTLINTSQHAFLKARSCLTNLLRFFEEITMCVDDGSLRWMGFPEAKVRMVEGAYEGTKGRVVCGPGISKEFRVDVGLRQGTALNPLLFIVVLEMVSNRANASYILRKLI